MNPNRHTGSTGDAAAARPADGTLKSLCVFCGASAGVRPTHVQLAARLGQTCARRGIRVVYGAGGVGVMGALSDAVLAEGGSITGVIPQALMDREYGRRDLTELRIVGSMHERKALMHSLSDAFVALPGGYGTLEELFEITAWAQLGLHHKRIVLLDDGGFFSPLSRMLDHARDEGFLSDADRQLVQHAKSVDDALRLAARPPAPPTEAPVIGPSQT
ncbi:TIGR00730 family Rossman fold protein [Streptomyces rimosus]|uniref:LOG family protein n=1 Tax=Streptomyces rimosus TaxID=1927 RepID=UPI0004CC7CAF|nr:TIGR00730 family Rossman fold protein [Streptomyces rimosus]